jgi:hypothetical protein
MKNEFIKKIVDFQVWLFAMCFMLCVLGAAHSVYKESHPHSTIFDYVKYKSPQTGVVYR